MRSTLASTCLWLSLCIIPLTAHSAPQRYQFRPADGHVWVQVYKDLDAPMASLAHDHVVRAAAWTGTLDIDFATPAACRGLLEVNAASLLPDEPFMRRYVGLPGDLSPEQRSQVAASLREADQIDVMGHPTLRFAVADCAVGDDSHAELTLTATIRGAQQAFRVPVTYHRTGDRLTVEGAFETTHEAFGFSPYSAMGGALRNASRLRFGFALAGGAG